MLDLRRAKPALWIVAALSVALPASASGAVSIGRTGGTENIDCLENRTFVQSNTGPTTPSYAVPAGGGVIVDWSVEATTLDQTLKLKVFRPTPITTVFTVVGETGFFGIPGPGIQQFPAQIPVAAGDRLGFTTGSAGFDDCTLVTTGDPADVRRNFTGDPPVGSMFTTIGVTMEETLNIAASVEPDADHDGFGDETQDQCPTDASTQGPCPDTDPPETTITKGAPNKLDKNKVTLKFTADEPEATFECKLDTKQFKPCTSPKKVKNLDDGKHKFKVVATDAAGNVDPSAAKDKFKVVD